MIPILIKLQAKERENKKRNIKAVLLGVLVASVVVSSNSVSEEDLICE